ncbi:glycosyl transferase [Grimontia sp. AD028]|uniref:glycosyltransferase family 2 protein n=1 Tax=Grimontia sp. AD028 TaxID=1581149 RepID=UPI00061B1899|nr:glycosyltransferase family 2 protein [Grimontia sp. AD028]KKD61331.1 glycosyl transferase [Grimontia sp. AD028]
MKISIITVCFNSEKEIEDTIESVKRQTYEDIEYIVVDGGSTDNTNLVVNCYSEVVDLHISENDEGLYDAMNKGIELATGDVIGILNSDDVLMNEVVIENIVKAFSPDIHGVYGDVVFCKQDDLNSVTRFYSSKSASYRGLKRGIMPAHPSLYLRKECFMDLGVYSLDYKIAADFDFVVRLFSRKKYQLKYLSQPLVKMREGGVSTSGFDSKVLLNKEILYSLRKNGIRSNWLWVLSKYPMKLWGVLKAKLQVYTQ